MTLPAAVHTYNALVAKDPAAALEQSEWLAEAFVRERISFDGEAMRSFLRPHLLERAGWERLRGAGVRLLELSARVARSAFDGDVRRLCAWLGTPERELPWVLLDPGPPDVLWSRLDAFVTPAGPRFIEINSDAPAGFGYGDRMARVFEELPLFRRFAEQVRVSYLPSGGRLVESVLRSWKERGSGGMPRVAVVDWADVRTRADQEILREEFERRGVPCVLHDPRELLVKGGRLIGPFGPIDVVYRRGLLSELVEREDDLRPFLEAYRDGCALFVNSFRCRLSEDKAFFALLDDEQFAPLLSAEEHAFVRASVPWTRRLEERRTAKDGRVVELVPYVLEHRDSLVLKPAHGYGGRSVFVGDETPAAEWASVVAAGLGQAWVVQERVAIPEEPFPVAERGGVRIESLKVNANPFYVAGAEVGAVARASRNAVINVSAGGGSVPTFVLD